MAAGDILSVTVLATGREAEIKVEGVAGGGTYLYDSANATLVTPASAKVKFTVVSKGFDATGAATTITRTVYGVATQRDPGTSNKDEVVSGSDLIITVALSEPIYAKDNTGVGNSGTAPTVTMLSGWYTKTGVPSAAVTTGAVTNNSSLAYYVPFGQWDMLPAERVTASFRVGFTARHLHGIAAVKFTATGATSTNVETATVTSESKRLRSVTGNYGTAHETTIALTDYQQNEQINLKAEVFPTVGDVEMDTDDFTVAGGYFEVEGRGPRHVWCDKNDALPVFAVVVAAAGGGTASTTYATAAADPFPTIKAALDANATVVYLKGAAHTFTNRATNKTYSYWAVITKDPSENGVIAVTIDGGFPTTAVTRLKFLNLTIKLSAGTSIMGSGANNYMAFDTCTLDANGTSISQHHFNFLGIYYKDCTAAAINSWSPKKSGDDTALWWDGCDLTATSATAFNTHWRLVGCKMTGGFVLDHTARATTTQPRNHLMEFNKILNNGSSMTPFSATAGLVGGSMVGNVIEAVGVAPSQMMSLGEGDSEDIDHVVIAHNTLMGERCNFFYNDAGSTPYYSRGIKLVGNLFQYLATKHDLFAPADAARVGRWWFLYGCMSAGNVNPTLTFPQEWLGVGTETSAEATFVDDQSGGGSGSGDYHLLDDTSTGVDIIPAGLRVSAYDIDGVAIPDDGTGDAGAYQIPPVVVPDTGAGGSVFKVAAVPSSFFHSSSFSEN